MTATSDDLVPPLPPNAPRARRSAFARWLGRSVLRLGGWRVVGTLPDVPRLVIIAAPHSSNWDGIWGFAAKLALGFDVRILGKAELFWWPLGALLRSLGVVPVDRASPHGTVQQAAQMIRDGDRVWFALAPEGTRKRVERWRTGFWKIAHEAQVPILLAYFHYPDKVIGMGPLFETTGDMEADMRAVRAWYRPWIGRNRDTT